MTASLPLWRRWLPLPWAFVLGVGLVLAGMRVVGVLFPTQWCWLLPSGFVVMAVLPWLLMTTLGRRSIGLRHATNRRFYVPACLFSPIGEEIFFRGLLHRALQERFGERTAAVSEAGLFGLVHVCHHGLWLAALGWIFLPLSGSLWVLLMFGTALLFSALRQRSGSLGPAVMAHATFNATMNTFIFAVLW